MPPKRIKSAKQKRSCRFYSKPSQATQDMIQRALYQRLFLVDRTVKSQYKREYSILGTTGNFYTVIIGEKVQCSCPDFDIGHICKHIIFTMIRVLQLQKNSQYVYQKGLLRDELTEIFTHADEMKQRHQQNGFNPLPYADNKILTAYHQITDAHPTAARKDIKGPCPICFDDLEQRECVWCRYGCGQNVHSECWKMWNTVHNSCVFCRIDWEKTEQFNDEEETSNKDDNKQQKEIKQDEIKCEDVQEQQQQQQQQQYEEEEQKYNDDLNDIDDDEEEKEDEDDEDDDDEDDDIIMSHPSKRSRKQLEEQMVDDDHDEEVQEDLHECVIE
ncbi:MAG: hypothetical protein EZS28_024162 [Streblomastix strix]|uniref:SWIM-type domain-containing protein n=1 Tax=Streblomastix strix TaxID=222440 RepID=A0A5J4VCU9_9EUKA|nr:MAG: hypothetical protein EZS28_024162 [Streblomastix strix]